MNLRAFGLLVDENVQEGVVAFLRTHGFDVVSVRERGWFGRADAELLAWAFENSRVVLTHDGDFGRLAIGSGAKHVGIVYLRPGHVRVEFTTSTIEALMTQLPELTPPFIAVAERSGGRVKIRVRQT